MAGPDRGTYVVQSWWHNLLSLRGEVEENLALWAQTLTSSGRGALLRCTASGSGLAPCCGGILLVLSSGFQV